MGALRVFITGASSGLGTALARAYAAQGATLGLLARRSDALQELASSLPGRHKTYAVDVNDHAALAAAAEDFIASCGGVDVVIANAGVSAGTLTEERVDLPVFDAVFATNVLAMVATFAPFIPVMQAQAAAGCRSMRLVGIASVAGIRGLPGGGAYSASKAAVISYCESLRLEMRPHHVRVVTIAPGYVDTPMTRINRYPMPFLMDAEKFAARACEVIAAGRSYAVIPWQMQVVAWGLRLLPNWLYDWLFTHAPRKARLER